MAPPTSIDGTDITSATIDGEEVQEITIDGQVAYTAGPDIPDSVVSQGEALDISASDNDSISSWPANVGSDLIGNGTYKTDGPNGNPMVEFRQQTMDASLSITEPFYMAVALEVPSTSAGEAVAGLNNENLHFGFRDNGDWYLSSSNGDIDSNTAADTNPHVLGAYYENGNTELRLDGSSITSGTSVTADGASTDEVSVGGYDPEQADVDIGKWSVADSPQQSDIDSIESDLASYLGISI